MKRALLLTSCLLCLLRLPLQAQTVQGVVLQEGTTQPVEGALIRLSPARGKKSLETTTDSMGAFLLHPSDQGRYILQLSHPSYKEITDTLSVGRNEMVVLELRLAPAAIPLQPLIVTARMLDPYGGFYARAARGGFGRFLMREDIERRPAARASELVQDVPGIVIQRVQTSPGMTTNLITTGRGGLRPCVATVYLDGMPIRQLAESGVDDFLNAPQLEGVEVYNSRAGIPAQFAAFDPCAVVAFWTRNEARGGWSWKKLGLGVAAFLLTVVVSRSF